MRAVVLALVLVGAVRGAAPPPRLTAEQLELRRQAEKQWREAHAAWKAGRTDEARAAMRRCLGMTERLYGPVGRTQWGMRGWLAKWETATGGWKEAVAQHERMADIEAALWGQHHWKAVDAQWLVRTARLRAGWTRAQNEQWDRAAEQSAEVTRLYQEGQAAKALRLAEGVLAARRGLVGEKHPYYANSLNNLATLHLDLGDHAAALARLRQALKLTEEVLGRRHPSYAHGLGNLAGTYQAMAEHRVALPLYRQAVRVYEDVLGADAPDYPRHLNNLASVLVDLGDYRTALPLLRRSLRAQESLTGRRHPQYAASLNNLAMLYQDMGDLRAAQGLLEEALQLTAETLGPRHPRYAVCLNNLGGLHQSRQDHKAALPLLQRSLRLTEETFGRRHATYATGLHNLAVLYHDMGDRKAALTAYQRSVKLTEEAVGRRHPSYARVLTNLGLYHLDGKDHDAALPPLRQALELRRELEGPRHPSYAASLHALALFHLETNRPGAALMLQEQAVSLTRRRLALDAAIQSERQQLDAADDLRHRLNLRLSLPDEAGHFSHAHALAWKGSAFAVQQARRLFVRAEAGAATRQAARDLLDATRSLALLASRGGEAARQRAQELTRIKEDREAALAGLSEPFRAALRQPSGERFRATLPPGVVLVDLLAYSGYDPDRPVKGQVRRQRLTAWIVRADAPTVRVDLGPTGPIVKDVAAWREAIEQGANAGGTPQRLRDLVWAPLEKHLDGAKVVLLSPDGATGRLPFAALPGREKGRYLLEEVPLAVLPVPQALAGLLAPSDGGPSLLTLGDVAFGPRANWAALPGTAAEIDAVAARFRGRFKEGPVSLTGAGATKAAVRGALGRHRFAHLATHGYFAPASMRSALDREESGPDRSFREGVSGWHPGLLSGLVLAGANNPTDEDDGVLTALEIAEMDLSNLDLAVLSACQTGLGQEAAGEGLLGLQRAFAVAGCRSVVSSLWSVNDAATSILMERFYHHLWTEKRSKLESLRQAQLDVLRHPEWVEDRAKKLAAGRLLVRGVGKASAPLPKTGERRSPPAWWAAWQLSGDWR